MSTQYAVAIIKEVSIGWKVTLGEKAVPVLFKGKNDALRFLERLGTGLPKQVFVYRSGQLEEAWFLDAGNRRRLHVAHCGRHVKKGY